MYWKNSNFRQSLQVLIPQGHYSSFVAVFRCLYENSEWHLGSKRNSTHFLRRGQRSWIFKLNDCSCKIVFSYNIEWTLFHKISEASEVWVYWNGYSVTLLQPNWVHVKEASRMVSMTVITCNEVTCWGVPPLYKLTASSWNKINGNKTLKTHLHANLSMIWKVITTRSII